jgi:hypothetical protein
MAYLWRLGAAEDFPKPMLARPRPPFPPMEVLPLTPFPPWERLGAITVLSSGILCSAVDICGCVVWWLQRLEQRSLKSVVHANNNMDSQSCATSATFTSLA